MKKLTMMVATGLAVAILTVLAACEKPVPPAQSAVAAPQRLGHAGRWLTDDKGRAVILRGFNMVNKFPPYTLSAIGFGEEDAALLAKDGFNAVRVGVIYGAVEPRPGEYDERYLDDIERTVAMLARHGILSLVDFHQDLYGPVFKGEGLPEWATLLDGMEPGPSKGFPFDYFERPAVARAFDNFWQNKPGPGGVGLQDRYAAAWRHVAARFARVEGVMGYDLMNEPFPGSYWRECSITGCGAFDQRFLAPFWRKLIAAIRQSDPATLIFYEPNVIFDFDAATHVPKLDDPRLGFSFHPYLQMAKGLGMAEQHAVTTGVALFATEWGATTDVAAIRAGANLMDGAMMSWLYWAWANKTPFDIPGMSGLLPKGSENQGIVLDLGKPRLPGNVHEDRLAALARPFPRAVAGTPVRFGYDPAKRAFHLTWRPVAVGTPLAAGAETEIFVPSRAYPRGYEVTVTGATVTSAPDDGVLRLVHDGRAPDVTVRLHPR
jgi:endoglycosylceramidase